MKHTVPYHEQEKPYTCGAAATRMFLESYGIEKPESELEKTMNVTKKGGCYNSSIVKYLKEQGFKTRRRGSFKTEKGAVTALEGALEEGPVITLLNRMVYNSKRDELDEEVDWRSDTESYHFVVVTGSDENTYSINNPNKHMRQLDIPKDLFVSGWFYSKYKGSMISGKLETKK